MTKPLPGRLGDGESERPTWDEDWRIMAAVVAVGALLPLVLVLVVAVSIALLSS